MTTRLLDDLDDGGDLGRVARGAIAEHTRRGTGGKCFGTVSSRTSGVHYHQLYQLVAIAKGGGKLGGVLEGTVWGSIVGSTTETEVIVGRGFGVDLMEATDPLWHKLGIGDIREIVEPGSQRLISAKSLRMRHKGAGVRHTNALRSVYRNLCKLSPTQGTRPSTSGWRATANSSPK